LVDVASDSFDFRVLFEQESWVLNHGYPGNPVYEFGIHRHMAIYKLAGDAYYFLSSYSSLRLTETKAFLQQRFLGQLAAVLPG